MTLERTLCTMLSLYSTTTQKQGLVLRKNAFSMTLDAASRSLGQSSYVPAHGKALARVGQEASTSLRALVLTSACEGLRGLCPQATHPALLQRLSLVRRQEGRACADAYSGLSTRLSPHPA